MSTLIEHASRIVGENSHGSRYDKLEAMNYENLQLPHCFSSSASRTLAAHAEEL